MEHANIKKIEALRQIMREHQVDLYIVPTSDYHESEYVGDHFKIRKYLTGFTNPLCRDLGCDDGGGRSVDGRQVFYSGCAAAGGRSRFAV